MAKSNNAEVEARVTTIFNHLVDGASRSAILQNTTVLEWGVSERQIDSYIAEATTKIIEAGQTHRQLELGRAVVRLHQLYSLGIQAGNLAVALATQKEINRLLGLSLEQSILDRIEALEAISAA